VQGGARSSHIGRATEAQASAIRRKKWHLALRKADCRGTIDEVNVLRAMHKPLFFRVGNAADTAAAPPDRLGEAVRVHARSLSNMQKEALVTSLRTGATWRLASDEGPYLDGDDEAPCPLSFVTTGMVCCSMEQILALAGQRGIRIDRIELVQDNFYTMRGSALQGTMTGGARDVELEARIEADADPHALTRLLHDAIAASPLTGLLRGRHASRFTLTHNGVALAPSRVPRLDAGPVPPLPDAVFDAARPDSADCARLVARNGMTPQTGETTGFAHSSLQEHQDRVLHVRGICTLRADGVKQVEQLLYNPHGSVFRFLCDEAAVNGGRGLAPDAASYVSAGIAFCFMTQLERYAKIMKKDLADCRIVQDTHFSLGGASGVTGRAGEADAVETHLFLETAEDDRFAQMALDMSEQTCFLHALCRTELETAIHVRTF
jgi:uncharacterized OsmC-like protein